MSREGLRVLEQRAVSRVGVRQQDRVRKVLGEPVGVGDGDHLVADTVHDQRGVTDAPELGEPLTLELFPLAKGRELSARDLRARDGIEVVLTLREPPDEGLTRGLLEGEAVKKIFFKTS